MGPSILFDKSAIQGLGQEALWEVRRYFYTTVPPVLLMEVLADLSLDPADLDSCRAKVAQVARKVLPFDSISNIHYRSLCVHNLLGEGIPMDRLPVVGGAKPVVAKDGSEGLFLDVQPENEAVLRWRSGCFSQDDLNFAMEWRKAAQGTDLEAMKQQLPKAPFKITSLEQVSNCVDIMLAEAEFQEPLLRWFLGLLRCDQPTFDRICFRWRLDIRRSLRGFAPYAVHCLRVQLMFYVGMIHGLVSTRPSNIVDLEYLCYTPFAFVFCSGDNLHRHLAPFVLKEDQTFVDREEMQTALNEVVAARKDKADAEPGEESLIRRLWLKHWGRFRPQASRSPISEEQNKRIMEQVKPIFEALQERERGERPRPRFPV